MTERQKVLEVAQQLEDWRNNGFEQSIFVYESASRSLNHTFEICKRKIAESNALESERMVKKKKVGHTTASCENDENTDPNTTANDDRNQHELGPSKEFKNERGYAQSALFDDESLLSMKVVELREELSRMGLSTKGVKKVLQSRLRKALKTDQVKEKQGSDSVEHVDMILENCTEAEVVKDKTSDSASQDLLAKDIENSEVVARVSCSQSICNKEPTPMEGIDTDESPRNEQGDDEIMEENSTDLIPDTSTDEYGAKDLDNQCSSNHIEDKMNYDTQEKISQSKRISTEEEIVEIVSKVEGKSNEHTIQDVVPSVNSTSSANKGLSYQFLKATTKLFSPNKNCKSSSVKSQEISLSPEEIATGYTIPNKNSANGDNESSHVQTNKSQNEKIPATLETNATQQYRRGSMSCKMSASDIEAHEKKGKAQTTFPSSKDKEKNGVICDEKNCLESKQKQALQPTSKSSSKPRSKIRAKPAVSSKSGTEHTIKKAEALLDARKARLAQMREKAKAVTLANSSKHKTTQQNRVNTNATAKTEDRRRAMAAEMRQKAIEAAKKNAVQKQVMSPIDTYEMSDRGESDSDSEGESEIDEQSSKKKIPKWAQKANLIPALEKQFLVGDHRLDPDEIFPEVETCDLEAIFDKKKKRYMKRASTGNWTKDSVTASEKLIYKRKMGFKKVEANGLGE